MGTRVEEYACTCGETVFPSGFSLPTCPSCGRTVFPDRNEDPVADLHPSLREKYSDHVLRAALDLFDGKNAVEMSNHRQIAVPDILECATYLKMVEG